MTQATIRFDDDAAATLVAWSRHSNELAAAMPEAISSVGTADAPGESVARDGQQAFAAARLRARRLGATVVADDAGGVVEFGFWAQDLHARQVPDERLRLPLRRDGAFLWSAVRGLPVGSRERLGALYWLAFADEHGTWSTRPDPLGASYPFAAFAPAEVYDVAALHSGRADTEFFRRFADGHAAPRRFQQPTNVLQLHVATATAGGTIASLTRTLLRVAAKRAAGEALTPFERCLSEYDAIQPLPLEPTIERVARAFMADAVAWCNVERHAANVDEAASAFGAQVRALRRARPWLANALVDGEHCRPDRHDGATLADALRCSPDGAERLWLVANLEGEAVDVDLRAAPGATGGWRVLLASPGALVDAAATRARPPDGEGVVLAAP